MSLENGTSTVQAHFNSLNVIMNSRSWTTILDFLHCLSSDVTKQAANENAGNNAITSVAQNNQIEDQRQDQKFCLDARFKKLNILLLRHVAVPSSGQQIGRKVATVTMSQTRVSFVQGNDMKCQGCISGLSLHDLTTLNKIDCDDSDDDDVMSAFGDKEKGCQVVSIGDCDDGDVIKNFQESLDNNAESSNHKALTFDFDQSKFFSSHYFVIFVFID